MSRKERFTVVLIVVLTAVLTLDGAHQTASAQQGYGPNGPRQAAAAAQVSKLPGSKQELRKPPWLTSCNGKQDTLKTDLYLGYRLVWFKVDDLSNAQRDQLKDANKLWINEYDPDMGWVFYYDDRYDDTQDGVYREARLRTYYTYDPNLRTEESVASSPGGVNDGLRLLGPTFRFDPGDNFAVTVHNRLPANGAELIYDRQLLDVEHYQQLNDGKLPDPILNALKLIGEKKQRVEYFPGSLLPKPGEYEVVVARESLEWLVTWKNDAKLPNDKETTVFKSLQIIRKEAPVHDDMDCVVYGVNRQVDAISYIYDSLTTKSDRQLAPYDWKALSDGKLPRQIQDALLEVAKNRNYGEGRLYQREATPHVSEEAVTKQWQEWSVTFEGLSEALYDELLIVRKLDEKTGELTDDFEIYGLKKHEEGSGHQDHNKPHDFNRTNLHVHGWQVSPHQDDIFRQVQPGFSSRYAFTLDNPYPHQAFDRRPSTHTSGTYWYHPHVHGTTALQVSSGASGLLLVDGGAIDQVSEIKAASQPEHEKHMVFNEIIYNPGQRICIRDPHGKRTPEAELILKHVGLVPGYQGLLDAAEAHPPNDMTINGQIKPIITMRPGEVQRWRMLHSGYHSALAFELVEDLDRPYDSRDGGRIQLCQFAVDGINFKNARMIDGVYMAPGNRTDVLVKAPNLPRGVKKRTFHLRVLKYQAKGEYFPDRTIPIAAGDGPAPYLATVEIKGSRIDMDLLDPNKDLPEHHHGFHAIDENKVVRTRKTEFTIAGPREGPYQYEVNNRAFNATEVAEEPVAGTTEAWDVSSFPFTMHPYHIHINPFQVVEFRVPELHQGQPYKDEEGNIVVKETIRVDPPMWKDTAMVVAEEGNLKLLTHYDERFTGGFVMHCHILLHEDMGMMQRIRILTPREGRIRNMVPPRTKPAAAQDEPAKNESARLDGRTFDAQEGELSVNALPGKPVLLVLHKGLECPHCAEQIQKLAKRNNEFDDLDVRIVAISPDSISESVEREYREKYQVKFDLLADENLRIFRAYGCADDEPLHGVFLVDATGRSVRISKGEAAETDIDKILRKVRDQLAARK